MIYKEIHIDGFGIFHDYHIDNLTSGINIFVGPNETGKSTILSFIKRILFGFPDRRSGDNLCLPQSGGEHGGRLIISFSNNSNYIIERYSKKSPDLKVTFPDGSIGGPKELLELLGHANKDILENIYAFGLKELQDFETLNNDAVKGRIYSAGTGSGAVAISDVRKNIEKEASNLFKESGSKPEINALFSELRSIDSDICIIEKDTQNFEDSHKKLGELTEKIANIEQERNQTRIELNRTRNLIKVWDDWMKLKEAKELLRNIPEITSFPEDGIGIFERILEKIDEIDKSIYEKKEALEKIKIRKSQIIIDGKLLINKDKIIELQKGQDKYNSAIKDLPNLEEKLKREKDNLKESLHEIGPAWSEEKLSNFDTSIPTKEIVRNQQAIIKNLKENVHETEKEIQEIEQSIKNLREEREELYNYCDAQTFQELDEKKLKEQRESLQLLRMKYQTIEKKEIELRNINEKEELITFLKPSRVELMPKKYFILVAGIAIVSVSLMVSFLSHNWVIGISIFTILSIIYIILSRKDFTSTHERLKERETNFFESKNNINSELQKIKNEMLSYAKICEFENIPDLMSIENKYSELQKKYENLLKFNESKKQQETLEKKIKKLGEELDNAIKKLELSKKKEEEAQKEWKDWLTKRELDSGLSPEGAIEIFAAINTCFEKKKTIEETIERKNTIQKYIKEYENKISILLDDCDRKYKNVNLILELEKITEELDQTIENNKALKQLNLDEENYKLEISNLEEKLKEQRKKKSEVLSQGFAESESEFRTNAKNWENYNKLKNDISQREYNIKRVIGCGEPYSDFIKELEGSSIEELKEEEIQLNDRFVGIENKLSDLRERRGGINKEIEQIERRDEGSSLRIKKAMDIQKLKVKSEEWAILTIASTIIKDAIKKYEKERQPGVIMEAQYFFSNMTLGRYSRIFAPLGEEKVYVIDRNGKQKDIQELSKGTAEQLYLSLRFGFIREFNKRAESLPIIFDEILVNFDPKRCQAACNTIGELAKTNQILYFTCHPENVEVLTKIIPEATVRNMSIND